MTENGADQYPLEKEPEFSKSEQVQMSMDGKKVNVMAPPEIKNKWDKRADEMGVGRSEFIRIMTTIGMRMYDQYDPTVSEQEVTDSNPLHEVILNHVDLGEENAKSVDKIGTDIKESVREEALDLLFNHSNVEEKKNQFYKV